MTYLEIRNLLKQNNLEESIMLDIVSCVSASSYELTDEEFKLICAYVHEIWDDVDKGYTQLIADIVCDCYQELGYGYRRNCKLTKKDLKEQNKRDKVCDLFYDKYYD